MVRAVIYEGPGFSLATDDTPKTEVPYPAVDRADGNRNAGFVSLVNRPELAETIHEAQRSPGLLALLKEVNRIGSRFLTTGCECGVFMHEPGSDPDRYVGSYIAICFRDPALNSAERIYELARQMIMRTPAPEGHNIAFEITTIPLKGFFSHDGCFELHVNAIGHGNNDYEAWAAFSGACRSLATAFSALYNLPIDDPLFQIQ
jgi:hypothetical protein